MRLVWNKDNHALQFRLEGQSLKVGRNKQNDIQIPDALVSGRHATITDGKLVDSGSTNGTFVNDQEVPKNTPWQLKAGDVITFGDTKIRVEDGKPYQDELMDVEDGSSSSDNDNGMPGLDFTGTTDAPGRGGPPWLRGAPTVNGANTIVAPASNKKPQNSEQQQHRIYVLQKQVEQLRADNMKMKAKLNPQRMRLDRKKQMEKERDYLNQIQNLQHQIFYGEEKEEAATSQLESALKQLEENKLEMKAMRDREAELKHLVEEKHEEVKALFKIPHSGKQEELMLEVRHMRADVQKYTLGIVLLFSLVFGVCVFLFLSARGPTLLGSKTHGEL